MTCRCTALNKTGSIWLNGLESWHLITGCHFYVDSTPFSRKIYTWRNRQIYNQLCTGKANRNAKLSKSKAWDLCLPMSCKDRFRDFQALGKGWTLGECVKCVKSKQKNLRNVLLSVNIITPPPTPTLQMVDCNIIICHVCTTKTLLLTLLLLSSVI